MAQASSQPASSSLPHPGKGDSLLLDTVSWPHLWSGHLQALTTPEPCGTEGETIEGLPVDLEGGVESHECNRMEDVGPS